MWIAILAHCRTADDPDAAKQPITDQKTSSLWPHPRRSQVAPLLRASNAVLDVAHERGWRSFRSSRTQRTPARPNALPKFGRRLSTARSPVVVNSRSRGLPQRILLCVTARIAADKYGYLSQTRGVFELLAAIVGAIIGAFRPRAPRRREPSGITSIRPKGIT